MDIEEEIERELSEDLIEFKQEGGFSGGFMGCGEIQRVGPVHLDLNRKTYRKVDITKEELHILVEFDYISCKTLDLDGRCFLFLCKTQHTERPEHRILVDLICDELRKYTEDFQTYGSRWPDIVFTTPDGKRIAIEVETGTHLKDCTIENKLKMLENFDGRLFVVSKWELKSIYSYFGKTVTRTEVKRILSNYFRG